MPKSLLRMVINLKMNVPEMELIEKLELLEEAFSQRAIGRYVGSCAEAGVIELTYLTEDATRCREAMVEFIDGLGLDATYETELEPFDGDEATFFEEIEPISIPKLMYFFGLVLFLLASGVVGLWNLVTYVW